MEGGDGWLGYGEPADQFVHALNHFGSRLISERHRQDGLRHHAQVFDQMGDAVGDDARLPAACTSQDEQRPLSGFDGFTLPRVKLAEKRQLEWLRSSLIGFYKGFRVYAGNPACPRKHGKTTCCPLAFRSSIQSRAYSKSLVLAPLGVSIREERCRSIERVFSVDIICLSSTRSATSE